MKKLIRKVKRWAAEKEIFDKATPLSQQIKTQEEVNELLAAIINNDKPEIKDAIGDITVTLIIQAEMQGMDFKDCLSTAYEVISQRKGEMINGLFVKEE